MAIFMKWVNLGHPWLVPEYLDYMGVQVSLPSGQNPHQSPRTDPDSLPLSEWSFINLHARLNCQTQI